MPIGQGDVKDVDPRREMHHHPKREQTGVPEHHVVAQGHPGENETEREHVERAGRVHHVDDAGQDPGNVQPDEGQDYCEQRRARTYDQSDASALHNVLPNRPRGRHSRTTASNNTTERFPNSARPEWVPR